MTVAMRIAIDSLSNAASAFTALLAKLEAEQVG